MPKWFSYDPNGDGLLLHDSAAAAKEAAEDALEGEREEAPEGWSEEVEDICWGQVLGQVVETERRPATAEESSRFDVYLNYGLEDVPTGASS